MASGTRAATGYTTMAGDVVSTDSVPTSEDIPDGYFIAHHRMTDSQYFGPFTTVEEAHEWCRDHPQVHGNIIGMFLTVDWNRR